MSDLTCVDCGNNGAECRACGGRMIPAVRSHEYDHDGLARHHHDDLTGAAIWWLNCEQFGGERVEHERSAALRSTPAAQPHLPVTSTSSSGPDTALREALDKVWDSAVNDGAQVEVATDDFMRLTNAVADYLDALRSTPAAPQWVCGRMLPDGSTCQVPTHPMEDHHAEHPAAPQPNPEWIDCPRCGGGVGHHPGCTLPTAHPSPADTSSVAPQFDGGWRNEPEPVATCDEPGCTETDVREWSRRSCETHYISAQKGG